MNAGAQPNLKKGTNAGLQGCKPLQPAPATPIALTALSRTVALIACDPAYNAQAQNSICSKFVCCPSRIYDPLQSSSRRQLWPIAFAWTSGPTWKDHLQKKKVSGTSSISHDTCCHCPAFSQALITAQTLATLRDRNNLPVKRVR